MRGILWLIAIGACSEVNEAPVEERPVPPVEAPPSMEDPSAPPAPPPMASIGAQVCEAIAPMLERGAGRGASLGVLRDGALVWAGGCGDVGGSASDPLDRVAASGVPADAATIWPVHSDSKMVLAIAVLQALEDAARQRGADDAGLAAAVDGLLDGDVDVLVDGITVRHVASDKPITLRMVMTHTSGVGDDYALVPHSVFVAPPDYRSPSLLDLREALRRHFEPGHRDGFLEHPPGEGYSYSSTASSIAALVVEDLAGTTFDAHTRRRIFEPLGMADTAWRLADLRDPARHARLDDGLTLGLPVVREDGVFRRPEQCSTGRCTHWEQTFYPAASLRSSALDLARLLGALMSRGGGLVAPELLVAAFDGTQTARFGMVPRDTWFQGLFFYWERHAGAYWVCHSGRNAGYQSNLCFEPAEYRRVEGPIVRPDHPRWGAIVLSNADGDEGFIGPATDWLLGETQPGGLFAELE